MLSRINGYHLGKITKEKILESFQGWNAYAKWANSVKLKQKIAEAITNI